jgi:oligo-1,6-glucosidase
MAVQGLEHYKSQEGNHAVLRELRRDVLDKYDCFTVGETVFVDLHDAKLLSDENRKELNMLFYFDHLEVDRRIAQFIPKKFRAGKLLEVITKWQRGLDWNAVYLENHDQARIVSHFGAAKRKLDLQGKPVLLWLRSAKMLALFQLTLRGTIFIYQGQEIGMTNFDFKSIKELDDVVSHGLNKLMKKLFIPAFLRWKWIKASSRDNARTPMQWDDTQNAGFTRGKPWLGINKNHKFINYASQKNEPASILSFYKELIAIRKSSSCLVYGDFIPVYANDRLILYQRKLQEETYTIALNFSSRVVKVPKKYADFLSGTRIIYASQREPNALQTQLKFQPSVKLLPWEGILVKNFN